MSKSQPLRLPAIFAGIRSRKDRSYTLNFETRELGGEDGAALLALQQTECWFIVAPSQDVADRAEVPDYRADAGAGQKTPSQRLRAVLFVYYKQLGEPGGDFDNFYRQKLEWLIDQYKATLETGEVSI
jgi:hypothetical protein